MKQVDGLLLYSVLFVEIYGIKNVLNTRNNISRCRNGNLK
jgi:hypothetical protein